MREYRKSGTKETMIIFAIWNSFIKPEAIAWSRDRLIKKKSYVTTEGQKVTLKDVI